MPRYNVTVAITLKLTTEIMVRAKDEETATERVQQQMEGRFGTLEWKMTNDRSRSDWNEEALDIAMDGIEED